MQGIKHAQTSNLTSAGSVLFSEKLNKPTTRR
jgi:hypothetical protein